MEDTILSETGHFFNSKEIRQADAIAAMLADLPTRLAGAWLFGAGAIGRSLVWHFRQKGLQPAGFVDNNPSLQGAVVENLPVISLSDYAAKQPDGLLVLALSKGIREVREQCIARGLGDRLTSHLYCRAALGVCPYGQRMRAKEIEENADAVKALSIWDDTASREKFRQLVRFQLLFDDTDLPPAEPGHYFSHAYIPKQYWASVVDAGAFDGDTLRDFLIASDNLFDAYYAFEPDPVNFQKLALSVPAGDNRIRLYNLGLAAQPGSAYMRGFGTLLSNIGDGGETETRLDSLDNVLGNSRVTLIKVDIEGYEPYALVGAIKTINRDHPALALSLYHQVDHLWSLPLWVRDLNLGYRLRIGCHGDLYSEAVCYAVPE